MRKIDPNRAALGFAAIGATARLDVLKALVRAGMNGLPVCEIRRRTGLPASTLAHHLRMLKDAELISQEKRGRSVINAANFDQLEQLAQFILSECCTDSGPAGEEK